MNAAQQRAIDNAIGVAEDNLYRAKMQKEADPNWISGNGTTIDEMIDGYQKELDALKGGE